MSANVVSASSSDGVPGVWRRTQCVSTDSKLPSVFPRRHYLDIIDEAWIADSLSDDEIDVPPGVVEMDPNNSELEPVGWAEEKVDRWNDLGLDLWAKDQA